MTFFSTRTKAEFSLVFATLIWGLSFPFIRIAVSEIHPVTLVFLRGLIALAVIAPFIFFFSEAKKHFFKIMVYGAPLGFFYCAAYLTQSIGLETISSARSAFLTNLTVIFVPLLSPLFKRGRPRKTDLISAVIALGGMFFLTDPLSDRGLVKGDLWTLGCALSFAFQIHLLQMFSERHGQAALFAFWQIVFISLFGALLLPFSGGVGPVITFSLSPMVWVALIYLGAVSLVLTSWLQSRYQCCTTPERAAVIYVLEPVFASVFGYLVLREIMTPTALFGGFLMILAVVWVDVFRFFSKKAVF